MGRAAAASGSLAQPASSAAAARPLTCVATPCLSASIMATSKHVVIPLFAAMAGARLLFGSMHKAGALTALLGVRDPQTHLAGRWLDFTHTIDTSFYKARNKLL